MEQTYNWFDVMKTNIDIWQKALQTYLESPDVCIFEGTTSPFRVLTYAFRLILPPMGFGAVRFSAGTAAIEYFSVKAAFEYSYKWYQKGNVCPAIICFSSTTHQAAVVVVPNINIPGKFMFYWINSGLYLDQERALITDIIEQVIPETFHVSHVDYDEIGSCEGDMQHFGSCMPFSMLIALQLCCSIWTQNPEQEQILKWCEQAVDYKQSELELQMPQFISRMARWWRDTFVGSLTFSTVQLRNALDQTEQMVKLMESRSPSELKAEYNKEMVEELGKLFDMQMFNICKLDKIPDIRRQGFFSDYSWTMYEVVQTLPANDMKRGSRIVWYKPISSEVKMDDKLLAKIPQKRYEALMKYNQLTERGLAPKCMGLDICYDQVSSIYYNVAIFPNLTDSAVEHLSEHLHDSSAGKYISRFENFFSVDPKTIFISCNVRQSNPSLFYESCYIGWKWWLEFESEEKQQWSPSQEFELLQQITRRWLTDVQNMADSNNSIGSLMSMWTQIKKEILS